jgi:hypothetical protein
MVVTSKVSIIKLYIIKQYFHQGSNYGCGTITGCDGKRKPTKAELDVLISFNLFFKLILK